MKRTNSTFKAMTSQPTTNNPAVPSMGGERVKVHFKAIHELPNFIKSNNISELNSRKIGKYKLVEYGAKLGDNHRIYFILSYKIKRTKYIIKSGTKITDSKNPSIIIEGNIKISKGIFKTKKFKLNELPSDIVHSINAHITIFNDLYGDMLNMINTKTIKKEEKRKNKFFNGLDT